MRCRIVGVACVVFTCCFCLVWLCVLLVICCVMLYAVCVSFCVVHVFKPFVRFVCGLLRIVQFVMCLRVLLCACVCVCFFACYVFVFLFEVDRVMLYGAFICGVLIFVCS